MDIKEIAAKVVAKEDVTEFTKDFTTEQNAELNQAVIELVNEVRDKALADRDEAEAAKNKELEEVSALRKEKTRLQTKKEEVTVELQSQFRQEQVTKARSKFMADFKLKEEDMEIIDSTFSQIDSKKIDSDLIFEDYKRSYAVCNADNLIKAANDRDELERQAAEFMASSAGGTNASGGGEAKKEYAPEVIDMVREAQKRGISMTLEEAERGMRGGTKVWE